MILVLSPWHFVLALTGLFVYLLVALVTFLGRPARWNALAALLLSLAWPVVIPACVLFLLLWNLGRTLVGLFRWAASSDR